MDIQQRVPAPPPPATTAPRAPGRVWAAAAAVGAVVGAVAFWAMPVDSQPPVSVAGDPELAARVSEAIAGQEHNVQGFSVAVLDSGRTSSAVAGTTDGSGPVEADTPFESGSVFKLFTAMTLADMVERGETELDATLGEVLADVDFADPDTAGITLEELATHHSGLPAGPAGSEAGFVFDNFAALDPFSGMPPVTESLAAASPGPERGEWHYSNFGYAVLGEALARVSGTAYPELVRERVLDPVGMDGTVIVGVDTAPRQPPEGGALPYYEAGSRAQVWDGPAYAAAGAGTWTTTADLLRFAEAVLDGSAPGTAALEPRRAVGEEGEIGLGWYLTELDGGGVRAVHDGGTFGSTAFLSVQRDADTAAVVLANTRQGVMPQLTGAALEDPELADGPSLAIGRGLGLALTLPFLIPAALLPLALMAGRRTLVGRRPLDRLRLVSMPLGASAALLLALRWGSWANTPHPLWPLTVALVATAAAVGAWYWRRVPSVRARWRPLRLTVFGLSVTVSTVLIAFSLWTLVAANG